MVQDQTFEVAFFSSEKDNSPRREVLTWGELIARLSSFDIRNEKSGPCWSPTQYAPEAKRGNAGVVAVTVAVLDVDDGTDPEALRTKLVATGLAYLIHSTFSSTPEHSKYRVVVPLAAPVPVAEWSGVFPRLCALLADGHTDPATKDPARIYYLPSARPGAKTFLYVGEGRAVGMADLSPAPAEATGPTQIVSVPLEGGKLPHGQHHRVIVSLAASSASRLRGITEEGLVQSLKGALTPLLDDLPSHDREVREAASDALVKFGKGPEESEGQDGPALYAEVRTVLRNYLHWPAEWCYDIGALWVMQAPIANLLPSVFYLLFSATKGHGKTASLDVLAGLTGALNASNISVAALVHSLKNSPGQPVCIDEFDVARDTERDSALASIARDGYVPGKPYLRWDPTKKGMDVCPTYGAKAFGFRGAVDDALEDRGFNLPLPTTPLRGREGAALVRRNYHRTFGDLPLRLLKWATARTKEGLEEREEEDWHVRLEALVGPEVYGANRETQLSGVVLAVADAVGVEIGDSLRATLGLKREMAEANTDIGVEEAREVLEDLIGCTGTLTKEAEFHVIRQKDFANALNARRKERRERPLTSCQIAKLRNDLGIEPAWLTHPRNRATWNIPVKEWTNRQGVANPPNMANLHGDADRVSHVSHVSQGVPVPPSGPVPEESHLGDGPTLADRALANARREGSLAPDPPLNPYYYPPEGWKPGEAPTEEYRVEGTEGVTIRGGEVFYDPPSLAPAGNEGQPEGGDPSVLYPGGVLAKRSAAPPGNILYRPPESARVVHEAPWEVAGEGAVVIYSDGAVVRRSTGDVLGRFRVGGPS